MKREKVNIDEKWFKGGKNEIRIDRLVPIHSKILPFVQRYYDQGGEYLITYNGKI